MPDYYCIPIPAFFHPCWVSLDKLNQYKLAYKTYVCCHNCGMLVRPTGSL